MNFLNPLRIMRGLIFSSRWLQAPLYLGLIIAQGVYVYHFGVELTHLFSNDSTPCISVPGLTKTKAASIDQSVCIDHHATGSKHITATASKEHTKTATGVQHADKNTRHSNFNRPTTYVNNKVPITTETKVMLTVLTLIDVVMIANLLVMVIIGGYETFVSRLHLKGHPDQPEWLSQVNAAVLKVKLAMALIGISSIHLLRTFILAPYMDSDTIMWHVIIHITFLVSAVALAYTDRLMHPAPEKH
ncbi:Probable transmembrane protein [hydrothermal vent metagenome]|uniref:Probable transmembrane protein n=1 Tax=hydrothermal vent metagenome TaxID=652676 RepID=A0A3B0YZA8_9ZZZZ